jgi:hypothetical protein
VNAELITQILTIALVGYVGWHLRSQLRTLKSAVDVQKAAIDAQAEQMKAQSTVLQDVERLNKLMQQVIDFFDPQAALQREQAYKARVEREAAMRPMRERIEMWYAAVRGQGFDRKQFANSEAYATLKRHLPKALQQEIDESRNPQLFVALPHDGIDPLQVRLQEEIAKLERKFDREGRAP